MDDSGVIDRPRDEDKDNCRYCSATLDGSYVFKCRICRSWVHADCLVNKPLTVEWDNYFDFTCQFCGPSETYQRNKHFTFKVVLYLAMYNLANSCEGRDGFFHLNSEIMTYILKNWELFHHKPIDDAEKANLQNKISSNLSNNNGILYENGNIKVGGCGYWKIRDLSRSPLFDPMVPCFIVSKKRQSQTARSRRSRVLQKRRSNRVAAELQNALNNRNVGENNELKPVTLRLGEGTELVLATSSDLEGVQNCEDHHSRLEYRALDVPQRAVRNARAFASMRVADDTDGDGAVVMPQPTTVYNEQNTESMLFDDARKEDGNKTPNGASTSSPASQSMPGTSQGGKRLPTPLLQKVDIGPNVLDMDLAPRYSFYSRRLLKPYIWVDYSEKYKECAENEYKASGFQAVDFKEDNHACVVYKYLHPDHIPALQMLHNTEFEKKSEMTDPFTKALGYADYCVVAFYERLIVGVALMKPDMAPYTDYLSHLYVRSAWRKKGIGSFMMYHLMQMSTAITITLHASITNHPAIHLYKSFGFVKKNRVVGYYQGSLPEDSELNQYHRDAFYMVHTRGEDDSEDSEGSAAVLGQTENGEVMEGK